LHRNSQPSQRVQVRSTHKSQPHNRCIWFLHASPSCFVVADPCLLRRSAISVAVFFTHHIPRVRLIALNLLQSLQLFGQLLHASLAGFPLRPQRRHFVRRTRRTPRRARHRTARNSRKIQLGFRRLYCRSASDPQPACLPSKFFLESIQQIQLQPPITNTSYSDLATSRSAYHAVILPTVNSMRKPPLSAKAGDKPKAMRFLYSTMFLGILFAALHIREWSELFARKITISSGVFGESFFTVTGLHLLHVIAPLSPCSSSPQFIPATALLLATSKPWPVLALRRSRLDVRRSSRVLHASRRGTS
jgi:hypothetical protein